MKNYVSLAEAASFLKMPQQSLYKLTSKRQISFYKPGKRILFEVSELEAWLQDSKKPTLSSRISPINSKLKS